MLSDVPVKCPDYLLKKSEGKPATRTAVAGAGSKLVLECCMQAMQLDLIEPILVGDVDKIKAISDEIGFDISKLEIVASESEKDSTALAVQVAHDGGAARCRCW